MRFPLATVVPGAPDVVVRRHGSWELCFGGSPVIVGEILLCLTGVRMRSWGVMARWFDFLVFKFEGVAWALIKIDEAAGVNRESSPSVRPGRSRGCGSTRVGLNLRKQRSTPPARAAGN